MITRAKRLSAEERIARVRALDVQRTQRRLGRERLRELRQKLREALAVRKERMGELVRSIREQRTSLRDALKARRTEVRIGLRETAATARSAAREDSRRRKVDAKHETNTVIARSRVELAEERRHQAEQRRLDREERLGRAEQRKALRDPSAHADLRAKAVAPFRPLFQKVKDALRPAPGESHEEAFLAYAESHPEVVHAHAEPLAERAIERTKTEIAAAERALAQAERAVPRESTNPARNAKEARAASSKPEKKSAAFDAALAKFVADSQRVLDEQRARHSPSSSRELLSVEPGRRYVRVVRASENGSSRSVYGFVDTTNGNVLKADSWKKPAKTLRGSIYAAASAAPREGNGWNAAAGYDARVLCTHCGCRGGLHRGSDGKCPATKGFGVVKPDPLSNWSLEGAKLDAALHAFWAERATFFRPTDGRGRGEHVTPPAPPAIHVSAAPNAYEVERAARVDRMKSKAERLREESAGAYARVRSIGDRIPMGQPILVGHHSQRRHERDIERMNKSFSKSIELSKTADSLERRARHAETNRAVSSDDPNAVEKLREKLAKLNAGRELMKAANAAIRKNPAKVDVTAALVKLGIPARKVDEVLQPDFAGRVGFPAYALSNTSSEMRRIEGRIKELEAKATAAPREEVAGDIRILEADNRVRLVFPGKPPEPTRKALKSAGFRWSPTANAWQRHASHGAWYAARQIAASAPATLAT